MINIWSVDSNPSDDVWIVSEDDHKDFVILKQYFDSYPVYLLKAKDEVGCNLAKLYLARKHYGEISSLKGVPYNLNETQIFIQIISAIEAFKRFENIKLIECLSSIQELSRGDFRYDRIICFLEVISEISCLMTDFFNTSIYGCLSSNCWWIDKPNFISTVDRINLEIEKITAPFKDLIKSPFDELGKIFCFPVRSKIDEIMIMVSSYCFNLSRYYRNISIPSYSLMLIHRSLDLYFTAMAIRNSLILVKRDSLIYCDGNQYTSSDQERIYLLKTYSNYISKINKLPPCQESILQKVNKKRNSLLPVHGVDGVSETELSELFSGAKSIMKSDSEWFLSFNRFSLKFHIDPLAIIYDLLGINTFLVDINQQT